jgi:catalase
MQVTDEDFVQPAGLWEVLGRTPGQQDNFIHNVAVHLCAARKPTRKRTYEMFYKVNKDLGARIEEKTEKLAHRPKSQV